MEHEIITRKISETGLHEVFVKLANGWTSQPIPCTDEEQARVYARGIEDGFRHANWALGVLRNRGVQVKR